MKDSPTRQRSTLIPTTFPVSVKNPRLAGYCDTMIERTDIEESSNNIAMNASPCLTMFQSRFDVAPIIREYFYIISLYNISIK